MRIIAISDTHCRHEDVVLPEYKEGDILVHAGDITGRGETHVVYAFAYWLQSLPYKHKIVIAGNHDFCFENSNAKLCEMFLKERGITYLHDSEIVIEGIKFYGSPYQPWFHNWAFNKTRGEEIAEVWAKIPDDTNVLITHGPPSGNLGGCMPHVFHHPSGKDSYNEEVGCEDLFQRMTQLKDLQYQIHGHIHECWGCYSHPDLTCQCVNASIMDASYNPVNKPWVLPLNT